MKINEAITLKFTKEAEEKLKGLGFSKISHEQYMVFGHPNPESTFILEIHNLIFFVMCESGEVEMQIQLHQQDKMSQCDGIFNFMEKSNGWLAQFMLRFLMCKTHEQFIIESNKNEFKSQSYTI